MSDHNLMLYAAFFFACAFAAAYLGQRKGHEYTQSWLTGLVLGPIGVIIMACAKPKAEAPKQL